MIQRLLKISGVSVVLFFPTTFLPEVSYLSHFLGYIFGIISGALFYYVNKKKFLLAELTEEVLVDDSGFDWENFNVNNILFRPLEQSDFVMLHDWLNRDHVARFWKGPPTQEEVNEKYGARLDSSSIFSFIVYFKDLPIGFIQAYETADHDGSFGIDQFIGDRYLLGKGIGSTFIKKFTDSLLSRVDVVRVISDPTPNNPAAIRAYQKAGFKRLGRIDTTHGQVVLMEKKKSAGF